jgi:hypothetical protein
VVISLHRTLGTRAFVRTPVTCPNSISDLAFLLPGLRVGKNLFSGADAAIKQYQDTFNQLKADFQVQAAVKTEITVLRIQEDVENLGESSYE